MENFAPLMPEQLLRIYCAACCVVQRSDVQCSAVLCSSSEYIVQLTVLCSAVQCSDVQCSAVICSAVQCSDVQCSAMMCSAVQLCAVQCSDVQ